MSGQSGSPSCATARDLLLRRADGELTVAEETRLEEHLGRCGVCAAEAAQARQLQRLLRRDPLPLGEVRLPSGEALAQSILQAEQNTPRLPVFGRPLAGWAAAMTLVVLAGWLSLRWPASREIAPRPVAPLAASALDGFWIEDDEQSGRSIVIRSRISQ